jgi:hypothetical protein
VTHITVILHHGVCEPEMGSYPIFQKDVSRPFRASNSHHIPAPDTSRLRQSAFCLL